MPANSSKGPTIQAGKERQEARKKNLRILSQLNSHRQDGKLSKSSAYIGLHCQLFPLLLS
jgi:hypothetical protein